MIIGMSCTRNWYKYMATNLYALFKNNKVEKLYLFIEDDEIENIKDDRIEYINTNKIPEYIQKTSPNYNTFYTRLSFARCYFTKVLKCDKIIYIDADAIVIDNIEELWKLDLEDNVIAGVHEGGEWNKHLGTYGMDDTYINTGIMVMDLKKLRKEELDDAILWLLNNKRLIFPDQDAINLVCRNRIKYLSNIYNSAETTGIADEPKIYHYIRGNKGWIATSKNSDIWFNYKKEMIMKGGEKMEELEVIANVSFDDYLGKPVAPENPHIHRNKGEKFICEKERALKLADTKIKINGKEEYVLEIVEQEKVEFPKVEEVREEKKETKKKATRKAIKK